jgi:thiol-disulfide isomerase/thioredoxin
MTIFLRRLIIITIVSLVFFPFVVKAKNDVNIYYFWGVGCPHCEKQKETLNEFIEKYDNVKVHDFEIWYNSENRKLLNEVGKVLKKDAQGIPFTVIGTETFAGFNPSITPKLMENAIIYYSDNDYNDPVGVMLGLVDAKDPIDNGNNIDKDIGEITLPIIGTIDPKAFSLPVLTIIFGVIDGFNPCAMWVLLFLISILIGMENKRRMWTLGFAFLLTSAFIYFLFMIAWLNVALFIGSIYLIRLLIALVAIGGGFLNLRSFFKKDDGGCKVIDAKKRNKIFTKIKAFTTEKQFILALIGIISLAISVNLVELLCSAGLPVIYTQILILSDLPTISYIGYIALYVLFFLIDDLIVFAIAMTTLQLTGFSTKYNKISHLIGGIVMIIIGILLAFKPGWLMFG